MKNRHKNQSGKVFNETTEKTATNRHYVVLFVIIYFSFPFKSKFILNFFHFYRTSKSFVEEKKVNNFLKRGLLCYGLFALESFLHAID